MKFMRVACWVWIVVSTTLILFWSPVSVTRQADKSRPQVTRIEWIGPFGEPLGPRYNITKSSIDFSRMIAALLAANFLPAVILWRFKTIGEWLDRRVPPPEALPGNRRERERREREAAFVLMLIGAVSLVCLMFYEKAHRVPPTSSSLNKQSSASGASPSPAPPSEPKPTAQPSTPQYSDLPPGTQVESTPQPTPTPQPAPAARTPLAPPSEPARTPPSSDFDFSTAFFVEYSSPGGRIKSKSDDGEIITLEDGSVWRVYPPDRINTASWTRSTYLSVVLSEVANRDRKRKGCSTFSVGGRN
jgi:hypothetical protein